MILVYAYKDPGSTLYKEHADHISCQFIAIYVQMKVELISIKSISLAKKDYARSDPEA